ncbi:alpha,alpha-trehalase nth1, variant 3 [Balamuthia mandrillaris]
MDLPPPSNFDYDDVTKITAFDSEDFSVDNANRQRFVVKECLPCEASVSMRRVAIDLAAAANTTLSLSPLLLARRTTAFPLRSEWVVPRTCSARAAFPVCHSLLQQERAFGASTREAVIMEASSGRTAARRSKRPIKLIEDAKEDEEEEEEAPLEEDDEEDEDYEDSKMNKKTSTTTRAQSRPPPPPQQPRKKRQRKVATRREKREPPPHWEEVLEGITEMRKERVAPVDTMGCAALADPLAEPKVQRFQTLVSLMLSSQTKDAQTAAAMAKLKDESHGGLTPESILNMSESKLDSLIRNVGFHARKTMYFSCCICIHSSFHSSCFCGCGCLFFSTFLFLYFSFTQPKKDI